MRSGLSFITNIIEVLSHPVLKGEAFEITKNLV